MNEFVHLLHEQKLLPSPTASTISAKVPRYLFFAADFLGVPLIFFKAADFFLRGCVKFLTGFFAFLAPKKNSKGTFFAAEFF